MIRVFLFVALLILPSQCCASDNEKVMKYLDQLASLRSQPSREFEKVEAKFGPAMSALKLATLSKLQKQLDQSFEANNIDSAIELKAAIEELSNYNPYLSDAADQLKFQNKSIKEFTKQLKILREKLNVELHQIEADFETKANQIHDELIAELKADSVEAMSKRDLDTAIKLRDLINSINEPTLFKVLREATEIEEGAALLSGHQGSVNSVAFSPDGKYIASGSDDKTIKIWDAKTKQAILTLKGHKSSVARVAFSPDGKSIVSGSTGESSFFSKKIPARIKVWDSNTGKEKLSFDTKSVLCVAFSPDGKSIASGHPLYFIKTWDAQSGGKKLTLRSGGIARFTYSPAGKSLACGSSNAIKFWDAKTGKEIRTYEGHSESVYCVAFSPDGNSIASGSFDRIIKIWDVKTAKEKLTLPVRHRVPINSIAYSPDGKSIVSGSLGTIKIWDAKTGKEKLTIKTTMYPKPVFSPDGDRIISASNGGVKIWTLKSDLSR